MKIDRAVVRVFGSAVVCLLLLHHAALAGSRSLGTTYLPLDHWANPVIVRAIAKGALPPQFLGLRPWTRTAIALLIVERQTNPERFAQDEESVVLVHSLEKEFAPEVKQILGERVRSAELESLYTRVMGVGGTPVRDTYHVGQTLVNDYGRPYGEGFNNVTGGTARATYRALGFAGQVEYQHAAGNVLYTATQTSTLASIDHLPYPVLPDNSEQNNVELLDTYAGIAWKRTYLSFGRESNWWGPAQSSAMLLNNNVVPMYMLKWDVAEPITLPWIFKYLGQVRLELYMGKLKGHWTPRQPYFHGEKVSLMPTKNLELGFSRTTEWAGFGHPITFHSVARTYFSVGDQANSNFGQNDPGDRRGGLDVSYKFPGLRNWLTIYMDSFVDDDPSPLNAPNRAAFHPGFYVSHIPGVPKLDFRAEGAYTELPTEPNYNGYFFYTNSVYRDGYTQKGLLMGDWIGREGKGGELSSTYWLAPDRTVQVFWKNHMIAPDFIPGGAHRNDIGTNINYAIGAHFQAGGMFQYETYKIPFLAAERKSNVTAGLTVTYWPRRNQSK